MKTAKDLRFPPRFEMEGLDPFTLKVVVVTLKEFMVFDNLAAAEAAGIDFTILCGPMADKHEGVRCVRFESPRAYAMYSN